jgi:hypothetical protein
MSTDYRNFNPEDLAQLMYEKGSPVAPTWHQLGAATKTVWIERAMRFLHGDPWWFATPNQEEPELPTRHRRRVLID